MTPGLLIIVAVVFLFIGWCLGVAWEERHTKAKKVAPPPDPEKSDEREAMQCRINWLEEGAKYAAEEMGAVVNDMKKHESMPVQEDIRRYRHTVEGCLTIFRQLLKEEEEE